MNGELDAAGRSLGSASGYFINVRDIKTWKRVNYAPRSTGETGTVRPELFVSQEGGNVSAAVLAASHVSIVEFVS